MLRNKILSLFILIFALLSLNACVAPIVLGGAAAAGAGKALYQDKTVGEAISDQTVWAKIRAALVHENIDSPVGSINVEVSEGRVLLTGSVKNREVMVKVVKICWQQNGVKEVINELKLTNEMKGGLKQYAQDSWITTRLKSKMFFNKEVKSVNYSIITIDGIVYILGVSQSQDELNIVTDAASQISGVKEVISYVRVRKNVGDVNGESGASSDSVDEFDDKVVSVDDFEDASSASNNKKVKAAPKKKSVKKKPSKKKSDEIFSEEDFESF